MNSLYVGLNKQIPLPKADFLLIDDEVFDFPQARIFDPLKHSFNPLANLNYLKACEIIEIFDAKFGRGDGTLTKENGLDFIAEALTQKPTSFADLIPIPDKKATTGHIWADQKVRSILRSPVLRNVFCRRPNFHFNKNSVILCRINRAELGEPDAELLAWFLIAQFKGQLVIPDFGDYGRPFHKALIRQDRLIAGVYTLSELDPELRQMCLLMPKFARYCTAEDALTLATYEGLTRGLQGHTDYVKTSIGK